MLKEIAQYAERWTEREGALLQELKEATHQQMDLPQMLIGQVPGRFLKLLVQLSHAKKVLEIGTFTGYSALCLAEGLPDDGELITCDIDPKCLKLAQSFFDRSSYGQKIQVKLGPALQTLAELSNDFDLIFIDADKANYLQYYESTLPKLKSGGLLVVDNCLWNGKVLDPQDKRTRIIHELNQRMAQDSRVENVLLTVRDGLHLARKK